MKIGSGNPIPPQNTNASRGDNPGGPEQDPQDVYVPTAVKLYDMSPVWWPKPQEYRIPLGVKGLC